MGKNIGIDLGASTTLMYLSSDGRIIEEPSVLAVDLSEKGQVLAAGNEAIVLCGRIPGAAKLIYPFRTGVDIDSEYFEYYIKYILSKAKIRGPFHPGLLICLSGEISNDREDDIYEIVRRYGIRDVAVVGKLTAASIGAGIDRTSSEDSMIVDIGGSETLISTISMGSPVKTSRLSIGGDALDASIAGYLAEKRGLRVNFQEAERIKIVLGGVWKRDGIKEDEVIGVNVSDGLPNSVIVDSKEIFTAIAPPVKKIAVEIRKFTESLSDDEYRSVLKNGIVLSGGGSLLYGLRELLEGATKIPVRVASEPIASIALGFEKLAAEF